MLTKETLSAIMLSVSSYTDSKLFAKLPQGAFYRRRPHGTISSTRKSLPGDGRKLGDRQSDSNRSGEARRDSGHGLSRSSKRRGGSGRDTDKKRQRSRDL